MQEDVEVAPVSLKNSRFENMFESLMGSGQKQVLMRFPSSEEHPIDIDSGSSTERQQSNKMEGREHNAKEVEYNMKS